MNGSRNGLDDNKLDQLNTHLNNLQTGVQQSEKFMWRLAAILALIGAETNRLVTDRLAPEDMENVNRGFPAIIGWALVSLMSIAGKIRRDSVIEIEKLKIEISKILEDSKK